MPPPFARAPSKGETLQKLCAEQWKSDPKAREAYGTWPKFYSACAAANRHAPHKKQSSKGKGKPKKKKSSKKKSTAGKWEITRVGNQTRLGVLAIGPRGGLLLRSKGKWRSVQWATLPASVDEEIPLGLKTKFQSLQASAKGPSRGRSSS